MLDQVHLAHAAAAEQADDPIPVDLQGVPTVQHSPSFARTYTWHDTVGRPGHEVASDATELYRARATRCTSRPEPPLRSQYEPLS
jgi:hypothetical protein